MIELKNIYYINNKKEILKDISLKIDKGKKYLLLGPSGSGKTTLLKIINYLYTPTNGEIFLNNKKYSRYQPHLLGRKIGLIMQDPIMFGEYVYENFDFLHKISKQKYTKEEILNFFSKFKLDNKFYHKKNSELSGGEKYRISIIRALLNKPKYLLTDEPFAALDKTLMLKIFDYLTEWVDINQTSLILVSHTFDYIIKKFDRVLFIKGGKLLFNGKPKEFLKSENILIKRFLEGNSG